jgi:hypothetical protein
VLLQCCVLALHRLDLPSQGFDLELLCGELCTELAVHKDPLFFHFLRKAPAMSLLIIVTQQDYTAG